jgi:hypothetical protein
MLRENSNSFATHCRLKILLCAMTVGLQQILCYLKMCIAQFVLFVMGWSVDPVCVQRLSNRKTRTVAIGYHTSNWDSIIGMLVQLAHDFPVTYVIKQPWLETPVVGNILKWMGFIGIENNTGVTDRLSKTLSVMPTFLFAIMPEGKRCYSPKWSSGFYYIAKSTGANIEVVNIDYARHRVTLIGKPISATNHSLEEVQHECQERLMSSSIPLFPAHAFPTPVNVAQPSVFGIKSLLMTILVSYGLFHLSWIPCVIWLCALWALATQCGPLV